MFTFNKLYNKQALYEAATSIVSKALLFPNKAKVMSYDEETLYNLSTHLPSHLDRLHKSLINRQFEFAPLLLREVVLNEKKRRLFIARWLDKFVDAVLYRRLDSAFESVFYPHSYSFRIHSHRKGLQRAIKQTSSVLHSFPNSFYVVRRDISSYFPSVDKNILLTKISEFVNPEDYLFQLLKQRIEFNYVSESVSHLTSLETQTDSVGIPFGTAIAGWFANLYLTKLDYELAATQCKVIRYADDYLVASEDRAQIEQCIGIFSQGFSSLNVKSKPSHEQNIVYKGLPNDSIFKNVKQVDYLGIIFRDKKILIGSRKIDKIKAIFKTVIDKKLHKRLKTKSIIERAEVGCLAVRKVFAGRQLGRQLTIDYFLALITEEEQLQILDRWLIEYIMYAATGYKHWRLGNLKHCSTKQLHNWGLISLLHRSRLLRHNNLDTGLKTMLNHKSLLIK